jgi:hypothetical protein
LLRTFALRSAGTRNRSVEPPTDPIQVGELKYSATNRS